MIVSPISAPWACMQVNRNCLMLFKGEAGMKPAMQIYPRAVGLCGACQCNTPAQLAVFAASLDEKARTRSLGEEQFKACFCPFQACFCRRRRRRSAPMRVATVPSCASERWWPVALSGGLPAAPGCQRRKETKAEILFLLAICSCVLATQVLCCRAVLFGSCDVM